MATKKPKPQVKFDNDTDSELIDFLNMFPMQKLFNCKGNMMRRYAEGSGGKSLNLSDAILIKWIAVTILLSVYRIPTSKLFKSKFF